MRYGLLVLSLFMFPSSAFARDFIHIVGSSTVFPFVAAAAEQFGRTTSYRTPIVEATGTGGGLKMFCAGSGADTPDIANASRTIKPAEIQDCVAHGVSDIIELKLGYDGIVFVSSVKSADFALTRDALFLALVRDVPRDGKLVKNPYKTWQQIDESLPALPIEIYGPPPTSGTRDAFSELVMEQGCKLHPEYARHYADPDELKQHCQSLREDGVYIEAGENDNLIVQKLSNNDQALAVFGYSFLEQNAAIIKAHSIDGVEPTFTAIISGKYTVSRSLYAYVKKAHIGKIPGIGEFMRALVSDEAVGDDGYLILKGLLPLPQKEHAKMIAIAKAQTTLIH